MSDQQALDIKGTRALLLADSLSEVLIDKELCPCTGDILLQLAVVCCCLLPLFPFGAKQQSPYLFIHLCLSFVFDFHHFINNQVITHGLALLIIHLFIDGQDVFPHCMNVPLPTIAGGQLFSIG